jgi:hypothetical protein
MGTNRPIGTAASAAALAALLAGSLWLRLAGLGAIPEVNGDESFYGIAAYRLAHGGHLPPPTVNGNIPDPFYVAMAAPLVAAFGPTFWALRLPGMLSGVLAVALAYALGRRVLDRPSASVAAGALAFLPGCVVHGGICCEHTQTPLFGLLTLLAAFAARPVLTLAGFAGCFLVHPWSAFFLPVPACVYVASALGRCGDRRARRRVLVGSALAVGLIAGSIGIYARARDAGKIGVLAGDRSTDWGRFLGAFGAMTSGATMQEEIGAAGPEAVAARTWAFWGVAGLALAIGLPRLVAERRWDRLALLVGTAAGMAALHVVAGGGVLGPGTTRYGYAFLAPLSLSLGVLVGPAAFAPADGSGGRLRPRPAFAVPLLALGGLLLCDVATHVVDRRARDGGGGVLAPWAARGMAERAFATLVGDLEAPGAPDAPRVLVAQSFWVGKPLQYLAMGRRDLRVVLLDDLGPDEPSRRRALARLLARGGYLAGFVDQPVADEARSATGGAALRTWAIEYSGVPFVTLARLARPEDAAVARGAGDGRRVR